MRHTSCSAAKRQIELAARQIDALTQAVQRAQLRQRITDQAAEIGGAMKERLGFDQRMRLGGAVAQDDQRVGIGRGVAGRDVERLLGVVLRLGVMAGAKVQRGQTVLRGGDGERLVE